MTLGQQLFFFFFFFFFLGVQWYLFITIISEKNTIETDARRGLTEISLRSDFTGVFLSVLHKHVKNTCGNEPKHIKDMKYAQMNP